MKLRSTKEFWRTTSFVLLGIIIFTLFANLLHKNNKVEIQDNEDQASQLEGEVLPEQGVELPVNWEDLGAKMVADGVIDETKLRALYKNGLTADEEQILTGKDNGSITLNIKNSQFMLNMLWAFGLSNKNEILTNGEMTAAKYGGDASKFASTGGWTISRGGAMNYYSKKAYVTLTPEQQALVDKVSSGIYRPCCGNSTHFPDCNHGMAMLGLLELMAANNVSESDMYKVALKVNSFWFPQTYIDLASYFKEQGQDWNDIDARQVLGQEYSSAQGYARFQSASGGGSCGV